MRPASGRSCCRRKVGRVGPSSDGEEGLELAVALLQEEELLNATIDVGARVVPGVGGVVLFCLIVGFLSRWVDGRIDVGGLLIAYQGRSRCRSSSCGDVWLDWEFGV